jgi:hypothetical protein
MPSTPLMYGQQLRLLFLLGYGLCVFVFPARSQTTQEEPLPGPDSHETGQGPHGHLFGEWGGVRTRLQEHGIKFDFQYVSDSLWNLKTHSIFVRAIFHLLRWAAGHRNSSEAYIPKYDCARVGLELTSYQWQLKRKRKWSRLSMTMI